MNGATTGAVALIGAMITPAILIMGAASLIASAITRLARVVDRARALALLAHEGTWTTVGIGPDVLRTWLERHAVRGRYVERSIILLYASVVIFVSTCISIAIDRLTGDLLGPLPIALAMAGSTCLLGGGAMMVAESRLGTQQLSEEIQLALTHLKENHR